MSSLEACTIVARNYLPYARALAESLREAHPACRLNVLVLDGRAAPSDAARFRALALADVLPEEEERHRLAFMYDVTELATAVKPLLLRRLVGETGEAVLFFDPDVQVLGPAAALWPLARESGILLTPHVLAPIPDDGLGVSDVFVARAGQFNLGFIGVAPGAEPFLEWWWQRLRRHCVSDPDSGLFVDQRWVDFVPSLFPRHAVLRHPGCNVAYWNLHEREVERRDGRLLVNGQPLVFFHWSGLDPWTTHVLSRHQGPNPRILLSERPRIRELCEAYVALLRRHGLEPVAPPYGHARLPDGTAIDAIMRRLYREELLEAERGGGEPPPLPFREDVLSWLRAPSREAPRVSRYLRALHAARPDVRAAFPSLHGEAARAYLDWVRLDPQAGRIVPASLRPAAPAAPAPAASPREGGLNVLGYLRAESGTGEAARLLASAAQGGGVPCLPLLNVHSRSRQQHRFSLAPGRPFDVTVVCANADETARALDSLPEEARGGYRIGFWFWETEELPACYRPAGALVDEIWTASEYVADAVRSAVATPVHVCPLGLSEAAPLAASREDVGLPPGFTFLFAFDFLSLAERKNPAGLVRAFRRAFREGEGPTLVLKSVNGHLRRAALELVREAARGRSDVVVRDGYVSAAECSALIGHCDCYVSLHRSEGFGLTLAEAMARRRPVIATGYSGNLAFMTPENSFLVPWRPALVPAGCEPYPEGHRWAEPDEDAAAAVLRTVYENRALALERGCRAAAEVRERLAPARTTAFLRARLEAIARARRPAAAPPRVAAAAETAALEAEALLEAGITHATRSRFGWPGRVARTAVLRLMRPYTQFAASVERRHLRATREIVSSLRAQRE
ncbi:MAG TPA: glycosyltransferase [Vicinamibacteria bacterium]|nr:glycosyltransferase [Vicinamibacteria bacterium]